MNSYKHIISSILFISLFCINGNSQKLDHVLGEVIIELPNGYSADRILNSNEISRQFKTISSRQLISQPVNIWITTIDPNVENENTLLETLTNHNLVINAQRNHITQSRATPNDERFENQWQYINEGTNGGLLNADLDMDEAWDISTGGVTVQGDSIVVCVIDDGVNPNHPDLMENLWKNHGEIPNNGIDDDENGYVDDYLGFNSYNGTDEIDDDGSHGTPVCGIVGAKGNNEIGVSGMSWDVKVMMVVGGSPESTAISSYAYAYTQRKLYNESNGSKGAFVVATNSSWGVNRGQPEDSPIWCDFYNLMGEVGIVSCGATANSNINVDLEGDLPTACNSDYLISVTNIGRNDDKINGAGFGTKTIDLGAYGENTYTLTKSNYGPFGGTSGATPHVAGLIGLMYSVECEEFIDASKQNPGQAALAVKDLILYGITDNPSMNDITVTNGRLNAKNAMENLQSLCESSCTEAYGLQMSEIDIFQTTASYLDINNTGEINIRYRIEGSTTWSEESSSNGSILLSNLEACTDYEIQSKTLCDGTSSEYGYLKYFKTEGCCEEPSGFSVTVEGGVASIKWENIIGADDYLIEYRKIGASEWISTNIDEEEATIPDIEECTGYEFRAKATCSVTMKESEYTTIDFYGECGNCTAAGYCEIPAKDTQDEYIESFKILNVFENNSGNNGGRGIFIGQFDITLNINDNYTFEATPGYESGAFAEFFSIYIDYDQSASFEPEERVYINSQSTNQTVSGDFTIPNDAVKGITRMRVIMRFTEPNEDACDNIGWSYGEYEDYCITIEGESVCPEIVEITSDIDSSETSLQFELTSSSKIEEYTVSYKSVGSDDWETKVFDTKNITLDQLVKCTEYDIAFSVSCQGGEVVEGDPIILKTSCSTSTLDLKEAVFSIAPNPSTGMFTIINEYYNLIDRVEMYTLEGKLAVSVPVNSLEKSISISETLNLGKGVYIVRIVQGSSSHTQKWVKI